jgi:hypothetical protein
MPTRQYRFADLAERRSGRAADERRCQNPPACMLTAAKAHACSTLAWELERRGLNAVFKQAWISSDRNDAHWNRAGDLLEAMGISSPGLRPSCGWPSPSSVSTGQATELTTVGERRDEAGGSLGRLRSQSPDTPASLAGSAVGRRPRPPRSERLTLLRTR